MVKAEATPVVKNPRNQAYGAALKALRLAHKDEFSALYKAECEKHGIDYVERMTAAERAERDAEVAREKAAAKVAELVEKYGQGILDIALTDPEF